MKVPIHSVYDQSKLYSCWKEAVPLKPAIVKYRVTDRCNAKCVMCSYWKKTQHTDLSLELVKRVNEEISHMGTEKVLFSGGEPTINKDLIDMISDSHEHGFETSLITNGSMLSHSFSERLVVAGLNRIDLSIDSYKADVHDKIRGFPGLWERAAQGIKNIHTAAKKHGVVLHTTMSSVIIPQNYKLIPEIVLLKKELGVENIHMYLTRPYVGGAVNTQLPLSEEQIKEFMNDIIPKIKNNAEAIGMPNDEINELLSLIDPNKKIVYDSACFIPLFHATVAHDGRVYPCCNAADRAEVVDFSMGNLNKQSFKDIWFGEKYAEFRKTCRDHLPGICDNCIYADLNDGVAKTLKDQTQFYDGQIRENIKKGIYSKKYRTAKKS